MKSGVVLAALVVVGFTVFELYAATRNGYRMEPAFVFAEFAEARRAAERCGAIDDSLSAKFAHNYAWARYRAGLDHSEREAASAAEADAWLLARERELGAAVDAQIDQVGCSAAPVRKFLLRERNLARLKLPAVPDAAAGH